MIKLNKDGKIRHVMYVKGAFSSSRWGLFSEYSDSLLQIINCRLRVLIVHCTRRILGVLLRLQIVLQFQILCLKVNFLCVLLIIIYLAVLLANDLPVPALLAQLQGLTGPYSAVDTMGSQQDERIVLASLVLVRNMQLAVEAAIDAGQCSDRRHTMDAVGIGLLGQIADKSADN